MAGSDVGRAPSSVTTAKTAGAPSTSAKTTTRSAYAPSTTGSERPVNRHVPSGSRRACTASARRDHATAPTAAPSERRWVQTSTSVSPRAVAAPASSASSLIAEPSASRAITVPANGTGARCRPSCSHSTATSTVPSPSPPSDSTTSRPPATPGRPWPTRACRRGGARRQPRPGRGPSSTPSSRRVVAASRSATWSTERSKSTAGSYRQPRSGASPAQRRPKLPSGSSRSSEQ